LCHILQAASAGRIVPFAIASGGFHPVHDIFDCLAGSGPDNLIVDLLFRPSKTVAEGNGIFRLLDADPTLFWV
jgi:hypothetical protein